MNTIKIKENKHHIELNGRDHEGDFLIRIHRDCSQLQIETEDNDAFIDLNYNELKSIRDAITKVLDEHDKLNS